MKKSEKEKLCTLIAEWEWDQGGTTTSAVAYAHCAIELTKSLGLSDEDLAFARAYQIYVLSKRPEDEVDEDDTYLFAIVDMIDGGEYGKVKDMIVELDFPGFRTEMMSRQSPSP